MIYALAVIGLLSLYLLWLLFKEGKRADELHETVIGERRLQDVFARNLLDQQSKERERWEAERQLLLQRIQDPQLAVGQAAAMAVPEPTKQHVGFDSDEEWWDAQRQMNGE
jgi:hypothetical protein